MEGLTEDEKKALRGSKFAPLPSATNQTRFEARARLPHPGGPMKTNKAAALAKFLERKLQQPDGLASVDPKLVELAVKNAKQTVQCSGAASTSGRIVHHVNKFEDYEDSKNEDINETSVPKKLKQKKKKKKGKNQKKLDDSIAAPQCRPKKKLKKPT